MRSFHARLIYQRAVLIHIQILIILNYSLPCWDLNPDRPQTEYMKKMTYQCANVLLFVYFVNANIKPGLFFEMLLTNQTCFFELICFLQSTCWSKYSTDLLDSVKIVQKITKKINILLSHKPFMNFT